MPRDAKLLGYILTDGVRYWCGNRGGQWRKCGRAPPKIYGTEADAKAAIVRLTAKRWDMTGVTAEPIRCP